MIKTKAGYKTLALLLALCLMLSLSACGGASVRADEELEGRYTAVVGEMLGIAVSGDSLAGFSVDLESGGKAVMTIDGDSHNVKWTNDDTTVTITVDGEEIVGTLSKDSFKVEDMLGMGIDLTFAKEGTDAAKPEQYLPENERFLLGDWQSVSVADILGDPVDDMAPDALQLSFGSDHTVSVRLAGEDLGTFSWSLLGDWGSVDDDGISLSWDIESDGITVNYSSDDGYYVFTCPKDGASAAVQSGKLLGGEQPDEAESEEEAPAEEAPVEEDPAEETTAEETTAEETPAEETSASLYAPYWDNDWYGWWMMESCSGDYEDLEDNWWDCCARIRVRDDDTGLVLLWDEDGSASEIFCGADVSFGPGTTEYGSMKSEEGAFWSSDSNIAHADWIVDPGASDVSGFDHMICIDGRFEDEYGDFRYYIYLRPWGMDWEDVRAHDEDLLPGYYDSWYVNVMDGAMPDKIGE